MRIDCNPARAGLRLSVDARRLVLRFPEAVWASFPNQRALADHYAFLKALHIPQMLQRDLPLEFATGRPLFKETIRTAMLNNIPFCADVDGRPAAENIRRFLALQFTFAGEDAGIRRGARRPEGRAVINMSFGKDSLLTYALAREMGLSPVLIMSVDNDCPVESRYKLRLARRFAREFGEKIHLVRNGTGVLHRFAYWRVPRTEWGFGHLITEYCLHALPFAHHFGARYVLLGSEKSCDATYTSREGYLCYPTFDQSSEWLLELTRMARVLDSPDMTVMSLIEPVNDLAIIRVLHTRYPDIARYQMSCFPDENRYGRRHAWCGHCTKCARMFIFMLANGVDARSVGLDTDMLGAEFRPFFPLFGSRGRRGATVGYDATPCGRDEQLYAFLLALERGGKGALMNLYRRTCLREAERRREELHRAFYAIQESRTMPGRHAARVGRIFRHALGTSLSASAVRAPGRS